MEIPGDQQHALERNQGRQSNYDPGPGLLWGGWPKTGRRSRPGKARVHVVEVMDNKCKENLPPKKRKIEKQYECDVCARSFTSYQALGGHKAHHNYMKEDNGSPGQYRCSFCSRIFSKGQALGGHKRHCRPPPPPKTGVFRFNLNDLPPEWTAP